MEIDDEARARVAAQSRRFSRGHAGARIVYDIEADFGLTRDQLRDEFSYYLDKFPVEIEESQQ